jgi:hypothetical protein
MCIDIASAWHQSNRSGIEFNQRVQFSTNKKALLGVQHVLNSNRFAAEIQGRACWESAGTLLHF